MPVGFLQPFFLIFFFFFFFFCNPTDALRLFEQSLPPLMINKMILFLEYFLWLTEDLKKISLICCNVSEGVALSKEQVVESRKIAGIRIHVERAISRIREFSFLAPHVRLDSNLISIAIL
jgi:hypothetical protein